MSSRLPRALALSSSASHAGALEPRPHGPNGAALGPPPPRSYGARLAATLVGPGALIAIGYVDPGNWATDLEAGSRFGYRLLWFVAASSLAAALLQLTSARLGVARGSGLAEAIREAWPALAIPLWVVAEVGIVSTDVAEVLGSALALRLLFGLPLLVGVALTVLETLVGLAWDLLWLQRAMALVVLLLGFAFAYEIILARPSVSQALHGTVPSSAILRDPSMLAAAVGVLGATVMPHNLYLQSALPVDGRSGGDDRAKARAIRAAAANTLVSLIGAMILNLALVVLAAATFYRKGVPIGDIAQAHRLIEPLLGSRLAAVVFALALLAAGQSASITATLAGQAVMTGFLRIRARPWLRRIVTRGCAIVPSLFFLLAFGEGSVERILVGSQIVLSLALPFAMVPLVLLTGRERWMGALRSGRATRWAGWICCVTVVLANLGYLWSLARGR